MKIVNTVSEELIQARLDDGTNVVTAKLSNGKWMVLLNPNLSIGVKNREQAEKVVAAIGALVEPKTPDTLYSRGECDQAQLNTQWLGSEGSTLYERRSDGWFCRARDQGERWMTTIDGRPMAGAFPLDFHRGA